MITPLSLEPIEYGQPVQGKKKAELTEKQLLEKIEQHTKKTSEATNWIKGCIIVFIVLGIFVGLASIF